MNRKRIDELVRRHYGDLDPEALAAPKADDDGVLRFRRNRVVCFLLDRARLGKPCDLNELWSFAQAADVSREEMQEFYRQIGYSLSGYAEIDWTRLPARRSK